jgi:hypothetical protein
VRRTQEWRAERAGARRAEAAYRILRVSTAVRFLVEAARAWIDQPLLERVFLAGGLEQFPGLAAYLRTMWRRIRPVGSTIREASSGLHMNGRYIYSRVNVKF